MTCKENCLHYDVCMDFRRNICETDQRRFEEYKINSDGLCDSFKDKSQYHHIPCKIGDTVWAIVNYKGTIMPQRGIVSEIFFVDRYDYMELCVVVKHVARGCWGEKVFASEEEAIKKIKGEKKDGN